MSAPNITPAKRGFDIALALLTGLVLSPVLLALMLWLLIANGRPVFHVSERMKGVGEPFALIKLRTMRVVAADSGISGPEKAWRINATGRVLRRTRLDELPQLWNILAGDMSFVGPRPPLREYVERFPATYAKVLACRPGLTGLATLLCHAHEARLLARTANREESAALYARILVPRKARLDLIYQRRRCLRFDLWLIARTLRELAWSRLRKRPQNNRIRYRMRAAARARALQFGKNLLSLINEITNA